ncbi:MAG: hypothetical protein KTR22_02215 [Flavobacteriaceae bacterium]|nr:hypothetical protein [Flavobacteriaceae bacterium]
MKYIVIVLLALNTLSLHAQNDRAYVKQLSEEFTSKLKERGIHDYVVSQHLCPGRIEMFKINGEMCISKDHYVERYVLWKEDGKVFLKKMDNCGLFHSIPLEDEALYSYLLEHRDAMEQEKVQRYETKVKYTRPMSRTKGGACGRTFQFGREGGEVRNAFSLFDLTNNSERGENVHYESNNQLKLARFHALLTEEIEKHTFKRQ